MEEIWKEFFERIGMFKIKIRLLRYKFENNDSNRIIKISVGKCGIWISSNIENKNKSFVVLHWVSITFERSNFIWYLDTFFYWQWK